MQKNTTASLRCAQAAKPPESRSTVTAPTGAGDPCCMPPMALGLTRRRRSPSSQCGWRKTRPTSICCSTSDGSIGRARTTRSGSIPTAGTWAPHGSRIRARQRRSGSSSCSISEDRRIASSWSITRTIHTSPSSSRAASLKRPSTSTTMRSASWRTIRDNGTRWWWSRTADASDETAGSIRRSATTGIGCCTLANPTTRLPIGSPIRRAE